MKEAIKLKKRSKTIRGGKQNKKKKKRNRGDHRMHTISETKDSNGKDKLINNNLKWSS